MLHTLERKQLQYTGQCPITNAIRQSAEKIYYSMYVQFTNHIRNHLIFSMIQITSGLEGFSSLLLKGLLPLFYCHLGTSYHLPHHHMWKRPSWVEVPSFPPSPRNRPGWRKRAGNPVRCPRPFAKFLFLVPRIRGCPNRWPRPRWTGTPTGCLL